MKLNLGCGEDIRKGYVNIDCRLPADSLWDLQLIPYQFKDSSVDEILALNVLEHLDKPMPILFEWYRILKYRGKLIIKVPHYTSPNAWADIQHKRPFSLHTFNNKNIKEFFHITKIRIDGLWGWMPKLIPRIYEHFLSFIFPIGEMVIEMEALK